MTATETRTAAPATTICSVTDSSRISQPRATATTGLTYAYVDTRESGATRRIATRSASGQAGRGRPAAVPIGGDGLGRPIMGGVRGRVLALVAPHPAHVERVPAGADRLVGAGRTRGPVDLDRPARDVRPVRHALELVRPRADNDRADNRVRLGRPPSPLSQLERKFQELFHASA